MISLTTTWSATTMKRKRSQHTHDQHQEPHPSTTLPPSTTSTTSISSERSQHRRNDLSLGPRLHPSTSQQSSLNGHVNYGINSSRRRTRKGQRTVKRRSNQNGSFCCRNQNHSKFIGTEDSVVSHGLQKNPTSWLLPSSPFGSRGSAAKIIINVMMIVAMCRQQNTSSLFPRMMQQKLQRRHNHQCDQYRRNANHDSFYFLTVADAFTPIHRHAEFPRRVSATASITTTKRATKTSSPVFNPFLKASTTITKQPLRQNKSLLLKLPSSTRLSPTSTTTSTRLWDGDVVVDLDHTIISIGSSPTGKGSAVIESHDAVDDDVPRPTMNGGFTHTTQSKAKISAANRGKVPWNKGKTRSDEVRARISAGVRARNREIFLKKLLDLGLTEEEYEEQKKEEKRQRERERRARKTAKGGYRPTEETKQKLSEIMKEKHRRGEVKKREYKSSTGRSPSPETRQKISESLKRKWATDADYREYITSKIRKNRDEEYRRKISETLKKRWQDPEIRERMLAQRTVKSRDPEYRKKVSEAIKKKWQDPEYRKRVGEGMKKKWQSDGKYRENVALSMSESIKKKWQDPDYRDRVVSTKKKKGNDRVATAGASSSATRRRTKVKGTGRSTVTTGGFELKEVTPVSANEVARRQEVQEQKLLTKKLKSKKKKKRTVEITSSSTHVDNADVPRFQLSLANIKMKQSGVSVLPSEDTKIHSADQSDVSLHGDFPSLGVIKEAGMNEKTETKKKPQNTEKSSLPLALSSESSTSTSTSSTKKSSKKRSKRNEEKDGSVSRLREERRDLFELLYGDDDDDDDDDVSMVDGLNGLTRKRGDEDSAFIHLDDWSGVIPMTSTSSDEGGGGASVNFKLGPDGVGANGMTKPSEVAPQIIKSLLDDEDLDSFDPYGLDDY